MLLIVGMRAQFIQTEELPIRFAHRVKELDELPAMIKNQPAVEIAKSWYANAFEVYMTTHDQHNDMFLTAQPSCWIILLHRRSSSSLRPRKLL